MELHEIIDLYESNNEQKIKEYEEHIDELKKEITNDQTYRNYKSVLKNLKEKILSVIVPTNIEDDAPRDFVIKICSSMNDSGCAIPYLPSQKQEWKEILHSLGDYMKIDFSDILKPDWNFRHTYGSDGELTPDSDGYVEGVSQTGFIPKEVTDKADDTEVTEVQNEEIVNEGNE